MASPLWVWSWLMITAAIAQTPNTTDPAEAQVINVLFRQWRIPEKSVIDQGWNLSGEPCSGTAVNSTNSYNGIKCNCNFINSICHITSLNVYDMGIVGTIPEGLWTLTYLTQLDVSQNYLTGSLSPSVGNLTHLQNMYISRNALSGEVPPELGRLTNLTTLAFGTNNFTGSLPPELGNLQALKRLYIDSSGVGGYIPSTFAKLTNLEIVWASDNDFTGRIPDFIGKWSHLQTLYLDGNSFEGSIPSTFSRLTSLKELKISGLPNATLDFIMDLNNSQLVTLSLRNNHISGSIPADIGQYQNLKFLDLSFNNLTGKIPRGLFKLGQISFLSLGNNGLSGNLPNEKSPTLTTIDVSYNELSGTLPSWVNEPGLQLNLVLNNFRRESLGSDLPSGLICLQRNFPCNQPRFSSFRINCGGPHFTSARGIVYEQDNDLGPATYYVTEEKRWGVSNVGPSDREPLMYKAFTSHQFTNSADSRLFQSARISTRSLRYYGLGLENGNYTVNLQFAELEIEDGPTWRSLGKRVFDIYVQGNLVFKDFDIKREAGGASNTSVLRQATVEVSDNHLEVHLFWSGKGTCCIPYTGTFGPLISAISATPNFIPTLGKTTPLTKKIRTGLIVGSLVLIAVVSFLSYIFCRRRKRHITEQHSDDYEEFLGFDTRPFTFGYGDLRDATNDFSLANKLGEGGFGTVYKGTLADGRQIAVKQLSIASHHGKSQFVAEIATISAVQHRNLVKLYGCCIDGERRLLVYEYLENKSLDLVLFGSKSLSLNWSTRFGICVGIARGLAYLHHESCIRIVHRDVKASNVLLDSNMNPKISDFGLAKLYSDEKTHMSTCVAGTVGYLAPEYAMYGHLTEKADVFGFGVVALEIISGRRNSYLNLEGEGIYLLELAWNLHEADKAIEFVDADLSEFDESEVNKMMRVGLLCTQTSPARRPSMSQVVAMLSGSMEFSGAINRPEYMTPGFSFRDVSTFQIATPTSCTDDTATSTSRSVVSPDIVTKPMLHDFIEEGN